MPNMPNVCQQSQVICTLLPYHVMFEAVNSSDVVMLYTQMRWLHDYYSDWGIQSDY